MTARLGILQGISWRRALSAIVLLVALGLLGYKAYTSWDALRAYDWQIRYRYLIPSFLLYQLQLVVIAWGWQSILNRLARPLPYREHLKIYAVTNLLRRIPAGALWMLAGRIHAYKNQDVSPGASALGSFLEFLLVILTGLPLAALAGAALDLIPPVTGIVLAGIALVVELGAIHPAVLGKITQLARHESVQAELTWRDTSLWALIYTLVWLISGIGLFMVVRLFIDLGLEGLPTTIGVWVLSSLIAYLTLLSPSGLGVKELSLTFLLAMFLPDPLPLLIALATRMLWTIYDLLAGVVALLL